jgi:RNA polymerase primary sigma factor
LTDLDKGVIIKSVMAKFRLDSIAELAREMSFTPTDIRAAQVSAAEELLHLIDPAKAYPLSFIIYRISGYHPKTENKDLLTGLALQHDLGLLIEAVSATLNESAQNFPEPVLDIDDVCLRFHVSSKTIQRWRRLGLPARRFIFPDGKRRVGFVLSSVEKFFKIHRDELGETGNFSAVTSRENQSIIRNARRLIEQGGCTQEQMARRIARRTHRTPQTIVHLIRKYEQEHPGEVILMRAAGEFTEKQRKLLANQYRRGASITELARALELPRAAIYWAIMEDRLDRILCRKAKFIDDPLFHQEDAAEVIDAIGKSQGTLAPAVEKDARVPRDLPPYLSDLYRVPLLSPGQERALFLKYNFHRYQFAMAHRRLDLQLARCRDVKELEGYLRRATDAKNRILSANMRLVASVARKHMRPGMNLTELMSDGSLTLMRAVEGFDIHRGYRFSTYATLALMKGFARSVPEMQARKKSVNVEQEMLAEVADRRASDTVVVRDELQTLLSHLDDRERRVVAAHYGLADRANPSTYEQLAEQFGLTKQRIRQIEHAALTKLRALAQPA